MTSQISVCGESLAERSGAETRLGVRDTVSQVAVGVLKVRVIENIEEITLELQ